MKVITTDHVSNFGANFTSALAEIAKEPPGKRDADSQMRRTRSVDAIRRHVLNGTRGTPRDRFIRLAERAHKRDSGIPVRILFYSTVELAYAAVIKQEVMARCDAISALEGLDPIRTLDYMEQLDQQHSATHLPRLHLQR